MDHIRQNPGQPKSKNKRSGGGNAPYNLAPGVLSRPRSRDASPNRGAPGFAPPSNVPTPHYPSQPTPSQPPILPPTQRVGLLPHPVFPPPGPPLVMPGPLPPLSQAHMQYPQGPPPPLPQPGELGGLTSLTDITNTVSSLGFPASCNFVLGLLQSYFTTSLASADAMSKPPSQLTKDNLKTLADLFILCQSRAPFPQGSKVMTSGTSLLTPLEEMQLLLSLHGQLEDQQSMELHYCIFDAIFGGITVPLDRGRFDILKKLVSFGISADSSNILCCASLWMKSHTPEAALLVRALYDDFCILLPGASDTLLNVPVTSLHLAQQLIVSFTSLYPFHTVGNPCVGTDPAHLDPPIRMLRIVSNWISSYPDLLSPRPLLERDLYDLPLVHSPNPNFHPQAGFPDHKPAASVLKSVLPGLIQWSVLAPLFPEHKDAISEKMKNKSASTLGLPRKDTLTMHVDDNGCPLSAIVDLSLVEGSQYNNAPGNKLDRDPGNMDVSVQSLIASLHANLLSNILSISTPLGCQLLGDDIAAVVATLIGYYNRRKRMEGAGKESVRCALSEKMDECVERLAQFLQICLSSGLLDLRPGDISSMASTLPKNRLLELVISHAQLKT